MMLLPSRTPPNYVMNGVIVPIELQSTLDIYLLVTH